MPQEPLGQTIILIRHAEKLSWKHGEEPIGKAEYVDNHELSIKGFERANAYASYFLNRKEIANLLKQHPLTGIFAQDVDEDKGKGWGQSRRPIQTVMPLGIYHLLTISRSFKA
jgi:hypothetical protein